MVVLLMSPTLEPNYLFSDNRHSMLSCCTAPQPVHGQMHPGLLACIVCNQPRKRICRAGLDPCRHTRELWLCVPRQNWRPGQPWHCRSSIVTQGAPCKVVCASRLARLWRARLLTSLPVPIIYELLNARIQGEWLHRVHRVRDTASVSEVSSLADGRLTSSAVLLPPHV